MLSLLLTVLAPGDPLPPLHKGEAAGIATDLRGSSDAVKIAAHPDLARREGRVLRIGPQRFVDEGAACDGSGCLRYRFDRPWFGRLAGVSVSDDENGDYLLVSTTTRYMVPVGDVPRPSPSGRYFFVGLGSDANDESVSGVANGSYVWQSEGPRRVRTVDDTAIHFEAFVGWHGDGCVEFTGFPDYGSGSGSRHYWLVQAPLEWALRDSATSGCTD